MESKKLKSIFSISDIIWREYDTKENKMTIKEQKRKNVYDLHDLDTYNKNGKIIHSAELWEYESAFRNYFIKTNINSIDKYLDWHFNRTKDQKAYLRFIKAFILVNSTIDEGIRALVGDWLDNIKKTNSKITKNNFEPSKFEDIFIVPDWEKYIKPLNLVKPMLISNNEFVGKPKGHKGVICSWFITLQEQSIVKKSISRQTLAKVLNNEFKNFNLSNDGKTFDNISKQYEDYFKKELCALCKLVL